MLDSALTPAARVVAWKIQWHLNRATEDAWPSEDLMARDLGLDVRTVRRGIRALEAAGYLRVTREARFNRYAPDMPAVCDFASTEARSPDKNVADTGHFCPEIPDKNVPLSPLKNTFRTPSRAEHTSSNSARRTAEGKRERKIENALRDQRGDEKIERNIIELFNRRGYDGTLIVGNLHELNGGEPRLRLFQIYRNTDGRLTEKDLELARLASMHASGRAVEKAASLPLYPGGRHSRGGGRVG
jgi:hypothetical protein